MPLINHLNLSDSNSRVYCCLRNRVVLLDDAHKETYCALCGMFNGDAGGGGVECLWDDMRETEGSTVVVEDPYREWASNQVRKVKTAGDDNAACGVNHSASA